MNKLMMLRMYWWSFVAFAIMFMLISLTDNLHALPTVAAFVLLVNATILFVWVGRHLDGDAWNLKPEEEESEALINEMDDDVPHIDPVTKVRKILNRTDKSDQWKIIEVKLMIEDLG